MAPASTIELSPDQLRFTCNESQFDFVSTAEVPSLTEKMVGQERALRAVNFGVAMPNIGYNIYAMGPSGAGKTSAIKEFLKSRAHKMSSPDDWCYVHNFSDPDKPRNLMLPAGKGVVLNKDIEQLISALRQEVPRALESEDYDNEKNRIMQEIQRKQNTEFSQLEQRAQKQGFMIQRGSVGVFFVPIIDGKPISPEQMAQLSLDERQAIEAQSSELQVELVKVGRVVSGITKEGRSQLAGLERSIAQNAIGPHIEELKEKYTDYEPVVSYLTDLEEDLIEHINDFRASEGSEGRKSQFSDMSPQQGPLFERYKVNVIVDNAQTEGAPVVIENNPTYQNLIGRVERQAQLGTLVTNFTMIKAGSLHRANGGYLVVEASHLLRQPFAYDMLKRALHMRELRITDMWQEHNLISTVSIEPEPIPLDIKVVMIGNPAFYYLLQAHDEEFSELFKVQADFDPMMDRTPENIASYVQFIKTQCDKEGLKHFAPSGVARLVEYSVELTSDQEKLSTKFAEICDLAREASFYSEENGNENVTREDVQKAIDEKIYRANRIEQHLQKMIEKEQLYISTTGEAIGQVNGLSVMNLGNYAFGKPSRLTARTYMGSSGVVSIEREVKTAGPIHNKGVMTLSGYINGKYGQNKPISMSAQISFEQEYTGVEGDSASSTELYALLSSLSGFSINQEFAVTGSVNQHGIIQPIGGATEKITGFYEVCKAFGFTGDQGVLIPQSNVNNLMLKAEIVEAVRQGKFHIYPVETIDQGIEILTGKPVGERDEEGNYPEGTINWAVEQRLVEFNEGLKAFQAEKRPEEKKEEEVIP